MRKVFLTVACLVLQLFSGTAVFAEGRSAETFSEGKAERCTGPISRGAGSHGVLPDAVTGGSVPSSSSCPAYFVCPSPPYSQSFVVVCNGSDCSVDTYNESVTCDGWTLSCADCEGPFGSPFCLTWR